MLMLLIPSHKPINFELIVIWKQQNLLILKLLRSKLTTNLGISEDLGCLDWFSLSNFWLLKLFFFLRCLWKTEIAWYFALFLEQYCIGSIIWQPPHPHVKTSESKLTPKPSSSTVPSRYTFQGGWTLTTNTFFSKQVVHQITSDRPILDSKGRYLSFHCLLRPYQISYSIGDSTLLITH